ncbi:hypothetical protein AWR36_014840 [Microbulbifer flavimaris]|uniref:DUF1570 domain-containing protein n=1 Tax=Microbulbifer flavimaris TaxID=1781068 RepID=A0ABX4HW44_9GAMM|nr:MULTISPECIES: hypothetical protein [Microbulbifer]KUJ80279.1 hypothetical protein AVO43_14795 [Microbulbifer sp. ZGT114]PCO04344.1 hypothetical protein AWR36_014840 [Microbulbifer flavimaris]
MRTILLFLFGLSCAIAASAADKSDSDLIYKTEHLAFHNNFWINLHHFFYEQASKRQRNKLQEDGLDFRDIGDNSIISSMSPKDKALLLDGIQFYRSNIIDQSLFDSGRVLKWLQKQPVNSDISDFSLSKTFTEKLNQLRPLYDNQFWKNHRKQNQVTFDSYIAFIKNSQNKVISKMEELSGARWEGTVRVDLSTYGNWASAYSPDAYNIVISTIDPLMLSTIFVEFVFHESSHLLFSRNSGFRVSIYKRAQEMGVKPPAHLWHAAMFYLCGLAVREALQDLGAQHQIIMKEKGVFENYYQNAAFKIILNEYYMSEIDREEMTKKLLEIYL